MKTISPNWLRLTHFRGAIRKPKRSVLIFKFLLRKVLSRYCSSSPSASMVTRDGKSNRKKSFGIYLHLIWQTKLNCMQRSSSVLFFVSRPMDVFAYIFDSFSFSWVLCSRRCRSHRSSNVSWKCFGFFCCLHFGFWFLTIFSNLKCLKIAFDVCLLICAVSCIWIYCISICYTRYMGDERCASVSTISKRKQKYI